jgi:hypothetical protein
MAAVDGAGFDAAGFREGILTAMTLGAPPDVNDQALFHFPNQLVYNAVIDGDNVPFDPAATVTNVTPAPVRIDCAIEYFDAENQPSGFGLLAPTRIAVTMLDDAYAKVAGCGYVVIAGDRYDYRRTEPPVGLFDVAVWTMHFVSPSDS